MQARSDPLIAATRFGLGPSARDIAAARSDPREYVATQVRQTPPTPPALVRLEPLRVLLTEFERHKDVRRAAARRMRRAAPGSNARAEERAARDTAVMDARRYARRIFHTEVQARVSTLLTTPAPLVERLVSFWSNHFAVIARGLGLILFAGNQEREAIRPFVLGRFEDMAKAAILHPAMLTYLDNVDSVGPDSRAGRRADRDINENLAREVLELHTLGVDGGYTQDDVRSLAMVLTGWHGGVANLPNTPIRDFEPRRHQPGSKTVFGRRYAEDGPRQALDVITELARQPATARHLSKKLARHFVSDRPPARLVNRLERTFLDTGGDLRAVTFALVTSDEAWQAPPRKFVPPIDFVVASMRASAAKAPGREFARAGRALGQQLWRPDAPTGFPDEDEAWLGGDHLLERLDWASAFANTAETGVDEPVGFASGVLGSDLDPDLETALSRAEDRGQALSLLFMSTQFQRR